MNSLLIENEFKNEEMEITKQRILSRHLVAIIDSHSESIRAIQHSLSKSTKIWSWFIDHYRLYFIVNGHTNKNNCLFLCFL